MIYQADRFQWTETERRSWWTLRPDGGLTGPIESLYYDQCATVAISGSGGIPAPLAAVANWILGTGERVAEEWPGYIGFGQIDIIGRVMRACGVSWYGVDIEVEKIASEFKRPSLNEKIGSLRIKYSGGHDAEKVLRKLGYDWEVERE